MPQFLQNSITYGKQIFSGIRQVRNLTLSQLRKVFSLMGKREKIALLALAILAAGNFYLSVKNFYISHTSAAPSSGGLYVEGILGQPTYINPLLAHNETENTLIRMVFSGLYKYDTQGNLVADIAEGRPEISEDQKQYTINLRKNVKWHNGKSLTADDIVYTIQILQDPAYKSPLRTLWLSTTVEKLSDYSVKFTTKDISGPFIHNLTLPILPKDVWSRVEAQNFVTSPQNLEAIGSGPYAIKEIKKIKSSSGKVESITLEAFPDYYNNRAYIDRVIVRLYDTEEDVLNALHSSEINGYGFVPLGSNLYLEKDQQKLNIYTIPLPQYQVVFFNLNNKFLGEQAVRSALSLSTNKQQIVEEVFKNNALIPTSPMLFNGQAQSSSPVYDVEKAKQTLDAAGWKVDAKTNLRLKNKQTLELTITTNDVSVNSKAAEIVADQWRALNIKVNLNLIPTKQLTDTVIRTRNFDVLLFPQKFGADPDPFLFWHSSQVKDPGFNLTGFVSQSADKLITEARTTTNQQVREQKYLEFNKLIIEQVPVIFLDQTVYIYAVDKNVKDVSLNTLYDPNQRFYSLPGWYMEEERVWR
jgi:peptide/nickel transport system substrate-binding protein